MVGDLQRAGISLVVCGGWVPFLKELASQNHTVHSMSLDIDLLLRATARDRESIDIMSLLLSQRLEFQRNQDSTFRYEKEVEGNIVQLVLPELNAIGAGSNLLTRERFYPRGAGGP